MTDLTRTSLVLVGPDNLPNKACLPAEQNSWRPRTSAFTEGQTARLSAWYAKAAVHDNAVYYQGLNDSANLCDELSRGKKPRGNMREKN